MATFVGRSEALHRVRTYLKRARREGFLTVNLVGAPGVGKTAFLLEVQRRFRHRTFALYFRHTLDSQAFFQQLGAYYPEQILHLPRYCPANELERFAYRFPFLQPYLPIDFPERDAVPHATPETLYPCVQGLAQVRPLLLLLDDMAPLSQLQDLRFLFSQIVSTPGLALVVSQDPSWLSWSQEQMNLPPFSLQEIREFLEIHGLRPTPEELHQWHEATGGFPLLLHLALRESLDPPPRSWLHEHLQDRLAQQIQALTAPSRRILALMSLLDTPLPLVLLDVLSDEPLEKVLEPLLTLGLLSRDKTRLFPPPPALSTPLRRLLDTPRDRHLLLNLLLPRILPSPKLRDLPWHRLLLPEPPETLPGKAEATFWLEQARHALSRGERKAAAEILHWLYTRARGIPHPLRADILLEYAELLAFQDPGHPEVPALTKELAQIAPSKGLWLHTLLLNRWMMAWDEPKARREIRLLQQNARSPHDREAAHLATLLYRLHFRKRREPLYQDLRAFMANTAYSDLRKQALHAVLTQQMCSQETRMAWNTLAWYRQKFPKDSLSPALLLYLQSVRIDSGYLRDARAFLESFRQQHPGLLKEYRLTWEFLWLWLLSAEGNHREFERQFHHLLQENERYPIESMLYSITLIAVNHYRELPHLPAYREQVARLQRIRTVSCARPERDAFAQDLENAYLAWMEQRPDEARNRLKALKDRIHDGGRIDRAAFYRLEGILAWQEGNRRMARRAWRRCIQLLESIEHRMGLLFVYRSLTRLTGEEEYRRRWYKLALETGALGWSEDPQSLSLQALQQGERGRLLTLGRMEIHLPGGSPPVRQHDLRYRRAWLLLGLLVAQGGFRGLDRQDILARLWPEASTTNPLDVVVSHIRKRTLPLFLETHEGRLRINTKALWVDAWAFERMAKTGLANVDPAEAEDALEQAVHLYKGPFLPGLDHPDLDLYRQHLAHLHRDARIRLGLLALHRLDARQAYTHAYQLISEDPYDEGGHRLMILSLWQQGHRGAALRHYEKVSILLKDHLGIPPAKELQRIADLIRQGAPMDPARLTF